MYGKMYRKMYGKMTRDDPSRPVTTRLPSPEAVLKPSDRSGIAAFDKNSVSTSQIGLSGSHGATLA
jgi:hypothetical protein